MPQERPDNWNWVKAIGECTAQVMIGRLREQAQTAIDTRMRQPDCRTPFELTPDGIGFSVRRKGDFPGSVFFGVTDDMRMITVCGLNRRNEIQYSIALDDNGDCKLRTANGELLDPWQPLKAALEALLFQ
jgi:hypothetical protein